MKIHCASAAATQSRPTATSAALLCSLLCLGPATALAGPITDAFPSLGAAGNFAVLALAGGYVNNSNVTINGNVGAVQGATINNMAPSTVNGNVTVYQSSAYGGPGIVTGSKIVDTTLMGSSGTVQTTIDNVIAQLNGYSNWTSLSDITSNTTLNASGTLNEYSVGKINLSNSSLTLNGAANQYFVIKVTDAVTLGGSGGLQLSGGLTTDNVIYYFTSTSGSCVSSHVGNVMYGIFLAPRCDMKDLDGAFYGRLISGREIKLMSDAAVTQPVTTVPEPGTGALMVTGMGLVGLLGRRRRRPFAA